MAATPSTPWAQSVSKNVLIGLLLSCRLFVFGQGQDACTVGNSVLVDYDGESVYGASITSINNDGSITFDWDDGSGSETKVASKIFSMDDSNCPTSYATDVCPVGTAVWAMYTDNMFYAASVDTNDGTTVGVSWSDSGTQDTSILEVAKVDTHGLVPCAEYCRCAVAGTGADPFTHFNGLRTQYWPPVGVPVKLLEVDGVQFSGTCYGNAAGNLWFGDFVLSKDNQDIISMSSADPQPLISQEVIAADSQAPRTLYLSVLSAGAWQNKTREGHYVAAGGKISLTYKHRAKHLGTGYQQAVEIQSPEMNVTIFSAKAVKFHDEVKQLKSLHLDMKIDQIDYTKVAGVLPEIWGLRPLTPEAKKMLQKPVTPIIV